MRPVCTVKIGLAWLGATNEPIVYVKTPNVSTEKRNSHIPEKDHYGIPDWIFQFWR